MIRVEKAELARMAKEVGFTDADYGLMGYYGESSFNREIGVEEHACGDKLLALLKKLGVEVSDD